MLTTIERAIIKWGVMLLTVCALATAGAADEQKNVIENNWQQDPMVARAPDGRTVYVWTGSGTRIRLFDATGHPVSDEEIVVPGTSSRPDLAVHDDGSFVVVWTDYATTVRGQRLTSTGELDGPLFIVNSTAEGPKNFVDIAKQPDEGFVVVWENLGADGDEWGIVGRVFDGMGQPVTSDFVVNATTTGDQQFPSVGTDGQGNALIVWDSGINAVPGLYGRWFDAGGTPLSDEFVVSADPDSSFFLGSNVAVADGGEAMVVWLQRESSSLVTVEGRFYNGAGAPSDVMVISTFEGNRKLQPYVAVDDSTGEFFVAWESRDQDAGGAGVFGRRIGADGVPLGDEIGLSDITLGNQSEPAVAFDGSGEMALVWQNPDSDGPGIFGNCLRKDGCPITQIPIFGNGFESGDLSTWSSSFP